jgi:hypothetical protein
MGIPVRRTVTACVLATSCLVSASAPLTVLAEPVPEAARCPAYDRTWQNAGLSGAPAAALNELSGIQASLAHRGVLWSVEDGNNGPHLFAFNTGGEVIGDFTLSKADVGNLDWEALGLDRRKGRDQLYIGDIGDNAHARDGSGQKVPALYRIAEPKIRAGASGVTRTITRIKKFTFRYYTSAGVLAPRNAESMFVDPLRHDVIVITKDLETIGGHANRVRAFRMRVGALRGGLLNHAKQVATLTAATEGHGVGAVSADIARDGRWIVVKNYGQGFLWHRDRHGPAWTAFRRHPVAPCRVPVDSAEAISFSYTDRGRWNGFWSVTETGSPPPPLRHLVGPD